MRIRLVALIFVASLLAGRALALPVVTDPGFDGSLVGPNSVEDTAPVYDAWVTFLGNQQFSIGGTPPDTYVTSNMFNPSGSRFIFQMFEDDKVTTGEITVQYDLNTAKGEDDDTLNFYVYGFNKSQAGGWTIANNTLTGTSDALFSDVTPLDTDTGGWETFATPVDLGSAGYDQIAIGFGYTGLNTTVNEQLWIDNVTVIPEPTTMLLGLSGLALFALRRSGGR